MVAEFSAILPRLSDVLETITLDGNSGREIKAPKDYPDSLNNLTDPTYINRMTVRRDRRNDTRNFRNYIVTVTMTLFLNNVGEGLKIINQYDIYGHLDKLEDLFTTTPMLENSSGQALAGVSGHITFNGSTAEIPTVRGYPFNLPGAPQYNAAVFSIDIPFRKITDC